VLKIGDFARLGRVTIKTLHHYERLGLIEPDWVNRFNGYRYYDSKQLSRLNRILTFKDLGFQLEQIGQLLDANLTPAEMRSLLARRRAELEEHIQVEQKRLNLVEARLLEIEQGAATPDNLYPVHKLEAEMEIKFVDLPAFTVMGMCYHGTNQHDEIGQLWDQFNKRASTIKHTVDGPVYGVCQMVEGLAKGEFEYVACCAVSKVEGIPQGMVTREIPALHCAVFAHRGAGEMLSQTYSDIYQKYLPEAGLTPLERGLDLEVYTDEFKFFAPDSVMYIYVPVIQS
jgi:predicted transcriptional regulator YdeE